MNLIVVGIIAGVGLLILNSKKSGPANYAQAAKAAQDAANAAGARGDYEQARKLAQQAADLATKAQQLTQAAQAKEDNVYYPATPETIAAGLSTPFEIANSGLGGSAPVGGAITVQGQDLINTGSGYALLTPRLEQSIVNPVLTEADIISRGFATPSQLAAMGEAEKAVYIATVQANL